MECAPSKENIDKATKEFAAVGLEVTTAKDLIVLSQVQQAMKGNLFSASFVLKEILKETDEPGEPATAGKTGNVDLETFCENAGYPVPFKQQVDFMNFAFEGGFRMVEAARGYGKTDYVAIVGAAYEIYKDPSKTFIVINKDREKASVAVKEIARCLKVNGVELELDNSNNFRVKGLTGKQDSGKAMSTKMSPKQNHPDFIICDDIVDIKDQYSPAERRYIRAYYDALSGLTDNITFLGQPVFYDDLYAEIKPFLKVLSLPHGSIPELDHDLEARRAAGISETFIQANYFLKVSAGSNVPFADIGEVDFFPSSSSFMWIDPSDGKGDYTAIAVMTGNFDNLIVVGFCFDRAWHEVMPQIESIWKLFKSERGGFEINKFGTHPVILLRQKGLDFIGRDTTENKEAKIQNAATHRKNIKLSTFIPNKDKDLIEANKLFNKTVKKYTYKGGRDMKDDAPDAIASGMLHLGLITMGKK